MTRMTHGLGCRGQEAATPSGQGLGGKNCRYSGSCELPTLPLGRLPFGSSKYFYKN